VLERTDDVDVAGKFYCTTFDWTAEPMDMGPAGTYTIFRAGSTQIGGMMATPAQMKDVPPHWLTYFGVTDCDGTVKKVGELGGKVLGRRRTSRTWAALRSAETARARPSQSSRPRTRERRRRAS